MSNWPPLSTLIVQYPAPQYMASPPHGESLPVSFPFFTRPAFTTNATGPGVACEPPVPKPVLTFIMCRKPAPVFHTCMLAPPEIVVESSTHVSAMQRSSTPPSADEVTVPGPAIPCTVSLCPATSTVAPSANVATPVTVTSSVRVSDAANTWSPSIVVAATAADVNAAQHANAAAARMPDFWNALIFAILSLSHGQRRPCWTAHLARYW